MQETGGGPALDRPGTPNYVALAIRNRAAQRFRRFLIQIRREFDMNETLRLLATRRSVGPAMLAAPGPDEAQLETLLTIAARVPDHGRLVPWRFLVIEIFVVAALLAFPAISTWLPRSM